MAACGACTLGAVAASAQVTGALSVGMVSGGIIGLAGTFAWLLHNVVPVPPGQIGYLAGWPWQAVSDTVMHDMIPAILVMILWVTVMASLASMTSEILYQMRRSECASR